jgi:hypothetical protein
MKYDKGRYTDTEPINQPQGTWLEGSKNLSLSQRYGSIVSEYGFKKLVDLDSVSDVCGVIRLTPNSYAIFLSDVTRRVPTSRIITLLDDGTTKLIISDNALNFRKENPIYGTATQNYKGESIVAFGDAINSLKIININSSELNVDTLEVFPQFKIPRMQVEGTELGGNLPVGKYHFVFRYKSKTGQVTPFQGINNGIDVHDYVIKDTSNLQIKVSLTNLESKFDFLEVAVIKNIDGEINAALIKSLNCEEATISASIDSTLFFNYTGFEIETTLLLEEIISAYIPYEKVGEIAQHENNLYIADLETTEYDSYQSLANQIRVNYVLEEEIIEQEYNYNNSTCMPDEVYALYIKLRLTSGLETRAYHIPGRAPIATDLEEIQVGLTTSGPGRGNEDAEEIPFRPKFEFFSTYNTATKELGYWENKNESYSNDVDIWGTLAGKKVRHHRMPDLFETVKNGKYYRIRLEVSNVLIGGKDEIESYEIFYAKRTEANSLVKAYDFPTHYSSRNQTPSQTGEARVESNRKYDGELYNLAGNWHRRNEGSENTYMLSPWDNVRFHPFDYIKSKVELKADYVKPFIKYTVNDLNNKVVLSSTNLSSMIIDYIEDGIFEPIGESQRNEIFRISANSLAFIPENSIFEAFNNVFGENHYKASLYNAYRNTVNSVFNVAEFPILSTTGTVGDDLFLSPLNTSNVPKEVGVLTGIYAYKQDIYLNFTNQILVSTGVFKVKSDGDITKITIDGDSHIGYHAFNEATGRSKVDSLEAEEPEEGFKDRGVLVRRVYPGYFSNDPYKRQYKLGDKGTYFYPATSINTISSRLPVGRNLPSTVYIYNKAFSSVNEYNPIFPEDYKPKALSFPFRVVKSIKFDSDNLDNNWFRFLAGDFYDIPTNRGKIIKIVSKEGRLLIHTEQALLQTVSRENLVAGNTEITLTTGELFRQLPIEIVESDIGFAGLQHKFAQLNTEIGHIFADVNQSKIFIFGSKLEEISNKGISIELSRLLNQNKDNPYIEEGIVIGYDNLYNRIIVTQLNKLDRTKEFTLSYSLDLQAWAFEHDYKPQMFLYTRNNRLFSLKGKSIYEHNIKGSEVFYDETPIECKLRLSINPEYKLTKNIFNVNWITFILENNVYLKDKTFTKIRLYNSYQDTGEIDIEVFQDLYNKGNVRDVKNTWNFNKIVDNLEEFYNKNNLIDKFFILELTYIKEEGKEIHIEDIDFKLRLVKR